MWLFTKRMETGRGKKAGNAGAGAGRQQKVAAENDPALSPPNQIVEVY